MSVRDWCLVCELSLYLVEPSELNPLLCRDCLPKLIGQEVICPLCIKAALLAHQDLPAESKKLDRALDRIFEQTLTVLDEENLSLPIVRFHSCCHEVALLTLLRSPAAMITYARRARSTNRFATSRITTCGTPELSNS